MVDGGARRLMLHWEKSIGFVKSAFDHCGMCGVCLGSRSANAPAETRADVVAPHSVALVGGPCGGKTSVIPVLRARL